MIKLERMAERERKKERRRTKDDDLRCVNRNHKRLYFGMYSCVRMKKISKE